MKKSITLSIDELIELKLDIGYAISEQEKWYEYFRINKQVTLAQDAFNKASLLKKVHEFLVDTMLQYRTTVKLSQEELP